MNKIIVKSIRYVSFFLSLTAITVVSSTVSAQAETASITSPKYSNYTQSSKSAARAKRSASERQHSSNINSPVEVASEVPTQQVIDNLGDARETPSPEAKTQPADLQQQQLRVPEANQKVNAEDQNTNQQDVLSTIPQTQMPVSAAHAFATPSPAAQTTSVKPKVQTPVPAGHELATTPPAVSTVSALPKAQKPAKATSAADLNQQSSTSASPQKLSQSINYNLDYLDYVGSGIAQTDITPGRPTRSGYSYIAVGGNIGITGGSTSLGNSNFALLSKIGLTRNFSVRPGFIFGNDTTVMLPITLDFPLGQTDPFETFTFAPYLGAGVAYSTDNKFGLLLTGGIDVPLSREFTATANLSASIKGKPDLGLILGIGYNFVGF